jgi:hypothetical protein
MCAYTSAVITSTAVPDSRRKGWLRAMLHEPPLRFVCRAACRVGLGSWEQRAQFDALPYSQYATGLQIACTYAQWFGKKEITAIEFGVAGGNGLIALAQHARQIQRRTGIKVGVVGFDTGSGLPGVEDWRDAPWLYSPGDYPGDLASLHARLAGRARLVVGDIRDTFPEWLRSATAPMGFISIDVDYYSSTAAILTALATCAPQSLLPIASVYLDDILCFGVPRCAGELAAIEEFNRDNSARQFDRADWVGEFRPFREALWLKRLFDLYCFDHPKMGCSGNRQIRRLDLARD